MRHAIGALQAASKQKDLVQRLESTILHWTRQIKEVVNQQDAQDASGCPPPPSVTKHGTSCGSGQGC